MMSLLKVIFLTAGASAFYIPGIAPQDFQEGETVNLKVNKLDSVITQLPYDYYSLPFCQPAKIEGVPENLGEILTGDRIENSDYELLAKLATTCNILCEPREYKTHELQQFASRIDEKYQVNWIVDNIPATTSHYLENGAVVYEKGFPLGFVGTRTMLSTYAKPGIQYLNNHWSLSFLTTNKKTTRGLYAFLVLKSIPTVYITNPALPTSTTC